MKLTEADAQKWHVRESTHYNGGDKFFAYLHRCVEQPRLARYDRYDRKTRSVTSTWRTDGQDHASLADAVDALNTPPVFDDDEIAFLREAPDEFTDIRKNIDWSVNERVVNKAGVKWNSGKCRITPAGRLALKEQEQ